MSKNGRLFSSELERLGLHTTAVLHLDAALSRRRGQIRVSDQRW